MKQLSLKQKLTLYTGIIFLGVMAIAIVIIMPSIRYIINLKRSVETTQSQIEDSYQKIRLLKKSINELSTIKFDTEKFDTITIDKGGELAIIRQLEQLSVQNNIIQSLDVSYNDGKPTAKDEKPLKPHYSFKFNLDGSFNDLITYIQGIESLPQYFIIGAMSLATVQKKEMSDKLHMTYTARIYSNE